MCSLLLLLARVSCSSSFVVGLVCVCVCVVLPVVVTRPSCVVASPH
jgi:hypothetical protein